jgi:ABC-type sugar transport system ATPase subunit
LSIKSSRASNLITSLSGGNQQKVLIGRAFAADPEIIVLDDPARGVDVGTKQELYAQLKDFARQGGAVVYLSSEIEDFFDFADRVLVFRAKTLFRTIPAGRFSEQAFLAAMFGEAEEATVLFEPAGVV